MKDHYRCSKCDYEGINEITLKKHRNTKHMKDHYRCDKCLKVCGSKYNLCSHIEKDHKDDSEWPKHENPMDCPLCEDKFLSSEAYDSHLKEHIAEIKG